MADSLAPITVTVRDSARMLGVPERTIRSWLHSGVLPYSQPGGKGGRVLVSLAAVRALAPSGDAK